tara:strand:- start:10283 stop:10483 length:201 start_codon:yes stop_codon:yes gene_type:complete
LPPPQEDFRGYEISKDLDKFIYTYCSEETIFGNCKKLTIIEIPFNNKEALKRLKEKGFILSKRKKL